MSGDVLSQAEVESLLSAMAAGGAAAAAAARRAAAERRRLPPPKPREKITPYDFKRPERVGKEQMRALQTLHEGFGRNFGAALSALLRSIVEVKLTSVDQLTYSEFVFSLENPTCFNLLKAEPLEGNLILDINPSILYPIIDRLLGGGREGGPLARRPLTEIELRLVSRITGPVPRRAAPRLGKRARPEAGSGPGGEQSAVGADRAAQRSGGADQLRADASATCAGMMNLCIPYNSIERIGGKLSANSWVGLRPPPGHAGEHRADQPHGLHLAGRGEGAAGADADQHRRADRPARGRHHHHGRRTSTARWWSPSRAFPSSAPVPGPSRATRRSASTARSRTPSRPWGNRRRLHCSP